MYAELQLKKPSEDTVSKGNNNATEYAEIVYVNSTPTAAATADKKT